MSEISLESIKRVVGEGSKSTQSEKTISLESIKRVRDLTEKNWENQYKSMVDFISSSNKWSSPDTMDEYIAFVEDRASKDIARRVVYDPLVAELKKRKESYGQFKTAKEYNRYINDRRWREKYKGSTWDDIQSVLATRERTRQMAGITDEADDEEAQWLKNYGTAVGYSDVESYDKEIAAVEKRIADNKAEIERTQYGTQVGGYTEEADQVRVLEDKNKELEIKKATLQRTKSQVAAQKLFAEKYALYKKTDDFAENSKFDYTVVDPIYRSVNGNNLSAYGPSDIQKIAARMEPDEAKIYNYLFKTQGKKVATEFFDDMRPILNQRMNTENAERAQKFADAAPGFSDIVTFGSQLIDGLQAPKKFIGGLTGDYEKNWAAYDELTTFTNTVRTDHAQDLNDLTGWDGAGFLYNTLMSIGDMGTALLVGQGIGAAAGAASSAVNTTKAVKGVTQFIMSSEAATQTMTDARQRGLEGWQISALGLASAGIEAITEKYSLDALFADPKHAITHIVKNMGTEAAEEATSNVLNLIADEVIAGNQSQIKQQIGELMASGMSYQEAAQKVFISKLEEIGLDALGGALSGGIMGGGSVALNRLTTVHFSAPRKNASLADTQAWVADKFSKLNGGVNVKGLGMVTLDADSMTDAIHKTKTTDQAVAFAAIRDILRKGNVSKGELGTVALINTGATLNGNMHPVAVSVQKKIDGGWLVTGLSVDGELVYDASEYAQQAQSVTEQNAAEQGESAAKLIDGQDGGFDYDSLNRITQTSGQRAPASGTAPTQGHTVPIGSNTAAQTAAFEQQNSATTDGDGGQVAASEQDVIDLSDDNELTTLIEGSDESKYTVIKNYILKLFGNKKVTLSDGRQAVVDRRDADHLMKRADKRKIAELSHLNKIFETAKLIKDDFEVEHNKFTHFAYYETFVKYGGETFALVVNVGKAKNDGTYHIYELNHPKIRNTADRMNGLSRPVGNAIKNGVSNDSISNPNEIVKDDFTGDENIDFDAKLFSSENEDIDFGVLELQQTALDMAFQQMNEAERTSFVQTFEKATGTRVVFDETLNAGGKYEDGVITVNPSIDTPMTVIKHELTHYIESSASYADFFEFVFKSRAFQAWMSEKGATRDEMRRAKIALYQKAGKPLGKSGDVMYEADQEILADFVGQKLLRDVNALAELAQKKRNIFLWIRDWFTNLIHHFRSTPMEREFRKMEQMFAKAVQEKAGVDRAEVRTKYSVQQDANGDNVVVVDTDQGIFVGVEKSEYPKVVRQYFKERFKGAVLPLGEHGDMVSMSKKLPGEYAYPHTTLDQDSPEYSAKMKAITELDNLLRTAQKHSYSNDTKGNPEATDGWDYYEVEFLCDGMQVNALINIANSEKGRRFYDLTKIKVAPAISEKYVALLARSKFASRETTDKHSISYDKRGVNTQYMQDDAKYSVSPVMERENSAGTAKFSFGVTQSDIDEYVEKAYVKENQEDYKKYAAVSERLIADTQDQIDISLYSHALRDNDIRHINNSHGEGNPNEKYPVTREDIKRIPDIVSNYDKVIVFEKSPSKKGLMYVKVAENGLIYYLEQATEKYGNEPLLVNKQMIKTGIDDIPDLPGLKEAINKKQETAEFLTDLKEAHQVYAQGVYQQSLSDPIKPQNGDGVNTQYMQDDAKYSVSPVMERENSAGTTLEAPEQEEAGEKSGVDLSEATLEQLYAELRKRNPKISPITIARLNLEDADSTPKLEESGVSNRRGDGDSSFAQSIAEADIFKSELKTLAASNSTIMQYDRIGNKETMQKANREINTKGRQYVYDFLRKESSNFTAEDVAGGFILMGRYNAVGDYHGAVMVAEKLREVGTESGQTVQAFSILGRLTPEGMQLYAQRELHKAYQKMIEGQTNKWAQNHKAQFDLTKEDIEFIRRKTVQASQLPDGRDKYVRLGEIAARIQSKIPPVKGQGLKAVQRTMMLLNPKTQLRNIFGNVIMTPQFIISDFIGMGLDKVISKSTGVRTKSGLHLSGKEFAKGAFNSWDDFVRHINTRNFEGGRFEIEGRSLDNFSNRNAFTRALNTLDRFNSFLLEAGDRSFYQMWFINSLNGQMKANHVTEPTAEMIENATQEALERTWQDDNAFTKTLSGLKNGLNTMNIFGYGAGDLIFKFLKTPANITKAMIEFSPAGFLKAVSMDAVKFSQAVKDGRVTPQMQRTFVKNLSNGITGTLMSIVGHFLARAGLATGKEDDDEDVADFERNVLGVQPYSVKIGDKYYSYDWANPSTSSLAIWADYFEDKRNAELAGEKREWYQNIIEAVKTGGAVLFNQSFMTSLRNFYGYDGPVDGVINLLLQDPSAFSPQFLSQVAATIDPTIRNTVEKGDDVKTAVNKILYKIPGARNMLAESVDVLGNTKTQHGTVWDRILNNFINPANVASGYDSAAGDEIYRLYQATGQASVIPPQVPNYIEKNGGKLTLDSHQKAEYQKITGKMATEAVEGLLSNKSYQSLSDDSKGEILSSIYSYSKQVANKDVLEAEMNESAAKAYAVISQGVPAYEYFLLKKTADANGNDSVSQEEAKAILDASDLTRSQKEIMWKGFNSGWKSNPYGKRYY